MGLKHFRSIMCIFYLSFQGTGEFINTKFFCRVCSLLHDPKWERSPYHIEDANDWWRGEGTCISGSWRKFDKALQHDAAKKAAVEAQAAAQPQPQPAPPAGQNAADAAGQPQDQPPQQEEPKLP